MTTTTKAKLCMIKREPSKSNEQIIDALLTALQYARENEVLEIAVTMVCEKGMFHYSGDTSPQS